MGSDTITNRSAPYTGSEPRPQQSPPCCLDLGNIPSGFCENCPAYQARYDAAAAADKYANDAWAQDILNPVIWHLPTPQLLIFPEHDT